jgi:hypothetical protein
LDAHASSAFFDADGDGEVTAAEIEAVLRAHGFNPDSGKTRDFVQKMDKDGNGSINLSEMAAAFAAMDANGDGKVTADEIVAKFQNQWAFARLLGIEALAVLGIEVVWSGAYAVERALVGAPALFDFFSPYALMDYALRLCYTLSKLPGCGNAIYFGLALGRGKLSLRHFGMLLVVQLVAILVGRAILFLLLPSYVYAFLATSAHDEWSLCGDLSALANEAATRAPALVLGTTGLTLIADRLSKALPEAAWLVSPMLAISAASFQWTTNPAYVLTDAALCRSWQKVWCDVSAVTAGACVTGLVLNTLEQRQKSKSD